jgi:hypothetical protein
MSTVAFISGYNLSRATTFRIAPSTAVDIMSDGTPRVRTLNTSKFATISCLFEYLTDAERLTLQLWLVLNDSNTITWTIDGINYSGVIVGGHTATMTGPLFNISFDYYAQIV